MTGRTGRCRPERAAGGGRRRLVVLVICGVIAVGAMSAPLVGRGAPSPTPVVVGSKTFTESVLLGEIAARRLVAAGIPARHQSELGGTRILWSALLRGEIDVYPDYTGTLRAEILSDLELETDAELRAALAERGVVLSSPLGFDNTYVLGMSRGLADELGIRAISDLRKHPELRFGFSNEFMQRADGWPGLRETYRLPHTDVRGLEHALAYRGLEAGDLDVIDLYSTDAEIDYYDLATLRDDLAFFPEYEAVYLWRDDLPDAAVARLTELEGTLDARQMSQLNARSKLEKVPEAEVARTFLERRLALSIDPIDSAGLFSRLWARTLEHLGMVGISLLAAIAVAIPLGVAAFRHARFGQLVLAAAGLLQTLPALALLVFLIPWLGVGYAPAIAALFLYSLLPILRNTHAGLAGIDLDLRESAVALGLPPSARLRYVELPLAARSILAGIKTAAVINVGTATLGALIGAGGYGQPILTGIRLDDLGLIFEGAVPAAGLAMFVQLVFEWVERRFVTGASPGATGR